MSAESKYCQDCGTKVNAADGFCSDCGAELRTSATSTDAGGGGTSADNQGIIERAKPTSAKTAVTGILFGLVIGVLIAWGLNEVGGAGAGFCIGFVAGTLYIWNKPSTHHSVASGLYVSAALLVFIPIMIYFPMIDAANSETARGAGEVIGGVLGLFIYTVVFAIIAAVIGLVGRSIKKRAPEV